MSDESPVLPCADKLVFESKKAAIGSATAIEHQRGLRLKPYKCQHCSLWHLSSR